MSSRRTASTRSSFRVRHRCTAPGRPERRPAAGPGAVVLAALLVAAAACSGGPGARGAAGSDAAPDLTILQFNDTYKIEGLRAGTVGGMARVRALRARLEAEGHEVLVLHAGDFLFPSVMSKYLDGAPMIDALNLLDGDPGFDRRLFVTFGNHEFDHSDPQVLFDRIAQSRFGWISSNLRVKAPGDDAFRPFGERLPEVLDRVVVEMGGIRIGIFGLTLDDQPRPWLEYDYAPEVRRALAERALGALERESADFVVALTHQSLDQDEALARDFPGRIDWIAGGHEHVYLTRVVGGTTITKADADAASVIRIDLRRAGREIAASFRRLELDASMPLDPAMAKEVAASLVRLEREYRQATGERLLDEVATTEHLLEGIEPAIRGRETALGDFLCDVLRAKLGTDIALVNGGAIRVNDDVPAGGTLRNYELEGIFYYDAAPVVFELTGRELVDLLRVSVSQADLGHGRFLQVSGLRFRYHQAPGAPARVDPAEVLVRPGEEGEFAPIELDRRYRVASLDYIWRNGYRDGYPLFSLGAGGTSPELVEPPARSWRTLTEEAIAELPGRRITTALDGRIERVEDRGFRSAGTPARAGRRSRS